MSTIEQEATEATEVPEEATEATTEPTAEPIAVPDLPVPEDPFEATFQTRALDTLGSLIDLIDTADKARESGKEAAKALEHVTYTRDLLSLAGWEEGQLGFLTEMVTDLSAQAGTDRTEGDKYAANLSGMLQSGFTLNASLVEAAERAVSAWQATAPKGTRKARESGGSATRTKAQSTHMECGCGWSNTDNTDYNSARWSWVNHLQKSDKHPTITVRPASSDPDGKVITSAVKDGAAGTLSDGTSVKATITA